MSQSHPASELVHIAFDDPGAEATALDRARIGDQQRLGVVLQGAAVLAHLQHAGMHLGTGLATGAWEDAGLDASGALCLPPPRRGRPADLPQTFLLRLLQCLFHSETEIAGRGPARRVARHLWDQWRQTLVPVPPNLAVAQILDSASFLWQPAFGRARQALAAEHRRGSHRELWLAGPGPARHRLLDAAKHLSELHLLLSSQEAQEGWEGSASGEDPWEELEAGRWRKAAALWGRRRKRSRDESLAYIRCLIALGRCSTALELASRRKSPEAKVLKLWCQFHLGDRHAATKTLQQLDSEFQGGNLSEDRIVQVAEVAVRILSARGDRAGVRKWVGRALACPSRKAALGAKLVAAGAAWDFDDLAAMTQYLDDVKEAKVDPELIHRWHQLEGLRRLTLGDGPGAVEHTTRALAARRRHCGKIEASRLWNEVAVARTAADDLVGAEKAIRSAVRLMMQCEGPAATTLAYHNLAQLRVRQGQFQGVEHSLSRMAAENRRSGNRRGLLRDLELWCRFELSLGRPRAALTRAAEARAMKGHAREPILALYSARAHGWLGHAEKAAAYLEVGESCLAQLEPEERPAIWALAGIDEEAAREAAGTPFQTLWTALLGGQPPPTDAWAPVDALIPYRAARLIYDIECLLPGAAPPSRVRWAVATFRGLGAEGFAEDLDSRSSQPWQALRRFVQAPPGADRPAILLRDAGYPDASLVFHLGEEEQILAEGRGGNASLAVPIGGGLLELSHPFTDPALEALLHVLARDLGGHGPDALLDSVQGSQANGDPTARDGALGAEPTDDEAWVPSYHEGILGRSPELLEVLSRLDRLAVARMPVLVLGDSGTGKELMARRVHQKSPRSSGPFVAINCGAISESLIQSELFGHVRGAFTGADRDRQGIFESARSGTVFLDEIGDLPKQAQSKLLRVLEEGEIRRVGDSLPRKVDIRVVAATHRDLAKMVQEGEFRNDLYFRLRVARVLLPPLRERGDDVLLLADFFAKRIGRELGGEAEISPTSRNVLLAHDWPGNVRELRNVLDVAAALAAGGPILPEHLDVPESALEAASKATSRPPEAPGAERGSPRGASRQARPDALIGDYHQLVLDYRRDLVRNAMRESGGNRAQAARSLGMTRQNLSYLVRQLFDDDPLLDD